MYYTLQEDQHLNCLSAFDPKGHTQTVETILDHKIKKESVSRAHDTLFYAYNKCCKNKMKYYRSQSMWHCRKSCIRIL